MKRNRYKNSWLLPSVELEIGFLWIISPPSVLPTVCRRKSYRVNRHFLNLFNFPRIHKPIQNKEKSQGTPSVSWLCFYGRDDGIWTHKGKYRKPWTGCITKINDNLYEGRYSPRLPNGKRLSRNIYAKTREECETLLAELIKEMKAEIQAEKERLKQEQTM